MRKLFLSLGFPIVLDQNSDNSSVVAVPVKVPPVVEEKDLPGKATFNNRSIRHFLIGSTWTGMNSDFSSAVTLSSQLSSLESELSSYVTNGVINESSLASDNRTLLEKLRTWHRLSEKLQYGMPLVSVEMLNWMADNDNLTITFKDMAKQVASITEWQQERIVFSNGFPVWTGKYTAPSDGKKTVKSMDLVSALARPIGKTAKQTAKSLTDGNEISGFHMQPA